MIAWGYGGAVAVLAGWQTYEALGTRIAIFVIGFAAALSALGVIWRKLIRPVVLVLRKINVIADAVHGLPTWQKAVDARLDVGSQKFDAIEGQLALLVSADRQEVAAAIEHVHRTERTGWRE